MSPTAPVAPVPSAPSTPTTVPKDDSSPQRITILSELDSYIAERMKEQPRTLEEVTQRVEFLDQRPQHRLKLPEYFEKYSGDGKLPGPFIFRWIKKEKRAVDRSLALGWTFVNRTVFPEMPRYLLTANGGVEVGDAILGFMPTKKALRLREAPAKLSQERLRGQMTQTKPDYVVMSGNVKDDRIYQPELGPETTETSEERVPGVLTEGRDF